MLRWVSPFKAFKEVEACTYLNTTNISGLSALTLPPVPAKFCMHTNTRVPIGVSHTSIRFPLSAFVSPESETKVRHNSENMPILQFARARDAYPWRYMGACCICRKVVVCTPQMCDESYLIDMCLLVMVSFLPTGTVSHIGCTCTFHPSCSKPRLQFFFSRWSLLAPSISFSAVPIHRGNSGRWAVKNHFQLHGEWQSHQNVWTWVIWPADSESDVELLVVLTDIAVWGFSVILIIHLWLKNHNIRF